MSDHRKDVAVQRYRRLASEYDATIGRRGAAYTGAVDALIRELLSAHHIDLVLDAGCGTGSRWQKLLSEFPDIVADGIDTSEEMSVLARPRGFRRVDVASIESIPIGSGTYDMVTCLYFVICYLAPRSARLAGLKELRRVLRPGGLLVIDAMNRWHLGEGKEFHRSAVSAGLLFARSVVDPRYEAGDKFFKTQHGTEEVRGFNHMMSRRSFRLLLEEAGFSIDRSMIVGHNTGIVHTKPTRGQLVMVCHRSN
jgi:SAM-dependent methyltransferase